MSHASTVELHPNVYTTMSRAAGFMPASFKGIFVFTKLLFEEFLCWFTLPVEMLIRRKIGVRAISLYLLLPLVLGSALFALVFRGIFIDPLLSVFFLGSAGFAVYHFRESRRFEASGGTWRHTFSNGEPIPFWKRLGPLLTSFGLDSERHLAPAKVVRFWEPASCFIVGLVLLLVSKFLGGFLIAASVALLLKAHIRHQRFVDAIRDRNDAMVTGQWLAGMPNRTERTKEVRPFVAEVALTVQRSEAPVAAPLPPEVEAAPSSSHVECSGCRARLRVKPGAGGRKGACPRCRTPLRAPLKVAG